MESNTTSSMTVNVTPCPLVEPKMYWWVLFYNPDEPGNRIDTVVDFHPFTAAKILNMQLLDWKLIAEQEYIIWKELNKQQVVIDD